MPNVKPNGLYSYIMEQNFQEQQASTPMPPKPDNNLVLAIVCTVCCCLPFGIVGIIKASKVNGLYLTKQYEAATLMAQDAKNGVSSVS